MASDLSNVTGENPTLPPLKWAALLISLRTGFSPTNGKPREMHSLWSWDSTLTRHDTTWHPRRTCRWCTITNSIKQHLQTGLSIKTWTWSLWVLSTQNILWFCVNIHPLNNSITIKMQQKSCCDTYFSGSNLKSCSCCNRFSFEKKKKQTFPFPLQV